MVGRLLQQHRELGVPLPLLVPMPMLVLPASRKTQSIRRHLFYAIVDRKSQNSMRRMKDQSRRHFADQSA